MKKVLLAGLLVVSMGADAAPRYIGAAYIDNHPSNSPGGIDRIYLREGTQYLVVKFSGWLGERVIKITGLGGEQAVEVMSNPQITGSSVALNVRAANGKWGFVKIPTDGSTKTPLIENRTIQNHSWYSVGVVPCAAGTAICPVLVSRGKYRVAESKNDNVKNTKPVPMHTDMCYGGSGFVSYDDAANKHYLNCNGRGARKSHALIRLDGGPVTHHVGSHHQGFSVRSVESAPEPTILMVNEKTNQIGINFAPFDADPTRYFKKFYARGVSGDWTQKLQPESMGEPDDAIDVSEYGFNVGEWTWASSDPTIFDTIWHYIIHVFPGQKKPVPPAGCKVQNNTDYITQGYGDTSVPYPTCQETDFMAKFNMGTVDEIVQIVGPTFCEDDTWINGRYWPKRYWLFPPIGNHYFWGKRHELEWDYWGCRTIPWPEEVN